MKGTVLQKFLAVLKKQKILGNIYFSEWILVQKTVFGCP